MNRYVIAGLAGLAGGIALLAGTGSIGSTSAQVDTVNPVFQHKAVTLAADTATPIPVTCTQNRSAVAIYNGDAANVFYGGSNVTTSAVAAATTGLVIAPSQTVNIEVSCNASRIATVYVRSAAGTAAFALRYVETR